MPKQRAVLDQLNIVVHDMAASIDFYQRLGVEIPETLPEWSAHHREVKTGAPIDVDLDSSVFALQWDAGWPRSSAGIVVGFRVSTREDVDDLYRELTNAGHVGQQPPYDAFWGARYAIVEDPSGNAVGLMSPADPSKRTQPSPPESS